MRLIATGTAVVALGIIAASPAVADRGGNGNARPDDRVAGNCVVSGDLVTATGLPTDEVVNFLVTDSAGKWGWVLGFTDDGTWSVSVPAHEGAATYEFVSRTWGPNGSKYEVFASC